MNYNFNKSDYTRLLNLTLHTDEQIKEYIEKNYCSARDIKISDGEITFRTKDLVVVERSKIDELIELHNLDKFEEAIDIGLKILTESPKNSMIYNILSDCYLGKKDFNNAIKFAKCALRLDIEDACSLTLLGDAMFLQNDMETAKIYWNEVYNLSKSHLPSLQSIGIDLTLNGYYVDGFKFLQKASKINPDCSVTYYLLMYCKSQPVNWLMYPHV